MALILNIETATKNCSVALGLDGLVLAKKEAFSDKYIHAEKLHEFIREVFAQAALSMEELNAVAVSQGPGSYTGLRIGVSAAKGLCYALNIPLVALDTTAVLAYSANRITDNTVIVSAIDARRNEAYVQAYGSDKKALNDIQALEIESTSFEEFQNRDLVVVGDAAQKISTLLDRNVEVLQQYPSAVNMVKLSEGAFKANSFVDVAYHEPFYLKDFVAGKPRKML